MKKKTKEKIIKAVLYTGLVVVSLVMLYPFFWMVASSLKSTEEILGSTLSLLPKRITFQGYKNISVIGGVSIWRYMFNSLYITGLSVLGTIAITALGAYALTRKPNLPGFKVVEMFFLTSIMYPYALLVLPAYIVMYQMGLLGTYAGIILFLCVGPIQFFLFKQFFTKIPYEMMESASIDGASELQILIKIIFPMAKPIFYTVGLITFILNWAQWLPVLVTSTTSKTYTLPVALLNLNTELGIEFSSTMALSTIICIPIIILFLFTQNKVMEGMAGGMK